MKNAIILLLIMSIMSCYLLNRNEPDKYSEKNLRKCFERVWNCADVDKCLSFQEKAIVLSSDESHRLYLCAQNIAKEYDLKINSKHPNKYIYCVVKKETLFNKWFLSMIQKDKKVNMEKFTKETKK